MKKVIAFLFFVIVWMSSHAHDIKMGMFDIYVTPDGYKLDMKFDRKDFTSCLEVNFPDYSSATNLEQLEIYIEDYIKSNLGIEIDGTCVEPEITTIELNDDFITVNASLNYQKINVTVINVSNTCLLDVIEGHNNIMKFNLMKKKRTFRLNEKRTTTVVKY